MPIKAMTVTIFMLTSKKWHTVAHTACAEAARLVLKQKLAMIEQRPQHVLRRATTVFGSGQTWRQDVAFVVRGKAAERREEEFFEQSCVGGLRGEQAGDAAAI